MRGGSGSTPFFQPAYCAVASGAARVGQYATFFCTISFQISGVPSSPCSMVSTPPRIARRIPSAVAAWATTGRPLLFATSTMRVISSSVNVGRASPFAPHR